VPLPIDFAGLREVGACPLVEEGVAGVVYFDDGVVCRGEGWVVAFVV